MWRSSRETRSCSTGSPSTRPDGPGCRTPRSDRLFAPRPATVAAVRSYLNANGLSVVDSTDMSLVVSGTAAATARAFGVGLRLYRDARGSTYQAPSGNVRLPARDRVGRAVRGRARQLAEVHPHYQIAKHTRGAPVARAGRVSVVPHDVDGLPAARPASRTTPGGYLPADLARLQRQRAITGGTTARARRSGSSSSRTTTGNDALSFRSCFNGIDHGHFPADVSIAGPARRTLRPGRGQPRPRGCDGRGAGRDLEGLQGAQQSGAPARRC